MQLNLSDIDWTKIDDVLIDMDGTLLDLSFDNWFWGQLIFERHASCHHQSLKKSRDKLIPLFKCKAGTIDWYCIEYWTNILGFDIEALTKEVSHRIKWRPGAIEFLNALKKRGIQTTLATNAHPKVIKIKDEQVGILEHVDRVFSSHQCGWSKESQNFWMALEKSMPFNRDKSIFFDDSEPVLNAAHVHGIKSVIAMSQADCTQPVQNKTRFCGITHFQEVMEDL